MGGGGSLFSPAHREDPLAARRGAAAGGGSGHGHSSGGGGGGGSPRKGAVGAVARELPLISSGLRAASVVGRRRLTL